VLLTAGLLAILAVLLADPVPRLLIRAHWVRREPVAALVLWQAVGLAAGLSVLGAGLEFAFSRLADSLPGAARAFLGNIVQRSVFDGWDGLHLGVLVLTILLGMRLFVTLLRSVFRVLASRQRQRDALEILATPWPAEPGVLVLDHPTAVAYCLPGSQSRLVISRGAQEILTAAQLQVVLAHERAHLRLRHDLVVLPFVEWGAALTFLGSVRRAQRAVAALVEMMADDAAASPAGERAQLRAALHRLGYTTDQNRAVAQRCERLRSDRDPLPAARVAAYLLALALILLPTLITIH
jgi:Zn-dependent protease with chaperone function